jgi:CBS domain-containing membrane protein
MTATPKPLLALTAADLMSRAVVTVPQDMPLPDAARVLSGEHISGAPVTDAEGHCVGMISSTDFVHWAEERARDGGARHKDGRVGDCMTADPVTVRTGMGIRDLARLMLDAHIHRVGVVDSHNRLAGIVSSTDVLAAVAYAGSGR